MSGTKIAAACVFLSFGVIIAGLVVLGITTSVNVALVGSLMVATGVTGVLLSMHAWTYLSGAS